MPHIIAFRRLLHLRQRGVAAMQPGVQTTMMHASDSSNDHSNDPARRVVRHLAATLAYRAGKVLRDPPADFSRATFGSATRQPVQIVAHMADLMAWAVTLARGEYVWNAAGGDDWDVEVRRFFDGLGALDRELAANAPFA